jgi:hypothetical protein
MQRNVRTHQLRFHPLAEESEPAGQERWHREHARPAREQARPKRLASISSGSSQAHDEVVQRRRETHRARPSESRVRVASRSGSAGAAKDGKLRDSPNLLHADSTAAMVRASSHSASPSCALTVKQTSAFEMRPHQQLDRRGYVEQQDGPAALPLSPILTTSSQIWRASRTM